METLPCACAVGTLELLYLSRIVKDAHGTVGSMRRRSKTTAIQCDCSYEIETMD